ncbi:type VI secretion system baseplate subunit TssE [Sandarakinorhabdus oryzae]|uniref:type VI secretion system baseplate subunit TssE n=1 Tax=Sandarakinorhabdus oryzae TaxID=2675220 RepID=UPI0012E173C8|nr:GPW/gp25 family protein [Sandarakinorhabdus oryzae]
MRDERPLKPSVLDKLIAPLGRVKGDGTRDVLPCHIAAVDSFGERDLKAVVIRDIAWIINDINFGAVVPLDDYPEIATSVLNQGVPDLTALRVASASLESRARDIATALRAFEPRLIASTVKVLFDTSEIDNENKVRFTITGELKGAIDERHVELKTAVALDSGEVEVSA